MIRSLHLERKAYVPRERIICTNCGDIIAKQPRLRNGERQHSNRLHCVVCQDLFQVAIYSAHTKIRTLIKRGLMESPKGKQCTDCGKAAVCYDLRNYSKHTEVAPICTSCNHLRGPGILGEKYANLPSRAVSRRQIDHAKEMSGVRS